MKCHSTEFLIIKSKMSGNLLQYSSNKLSYYLFQIIQTHILEKKNWLFRDIWKLVVREGSRALLSCFIYRLSHNLCESYFWILVVFICLCVFLQSGLSLNFFSFNLFTCIFSCCFWNTSGIWWCCFFLINIFYYFSPPLRYEYTML